MTMNEAWLTLLRCPVTRQSLRWASDEEKRTHAVPEGETAVITQDGARLYGSQGGILHLLPDSHLPEAPK